MKLERTAMMAALAGTTSVLVLGTGLALGRGQAPPAPAGQGQEGKAASAPSLVNPSRDNIVDPLVQDLLKAARDRLAAQRAYYEEGRITIDRFVQASEALMEVERMVARGEAETLAAMERHVTRLKEIEQREKDSLAAGRSTRSDVTEITQNRLEAEVLLDRAKRAKPAPDVAALERRLGEVERKLDALSKLRGRDMPVTPQP